MKGGQFRVGSQNQFSKLRDGKTWSACDNGESSIAGLNYGSVVNNFTNDDWNGMYHSIAAPNVVGQPSTQACTVCFDAEVASFEGFSSGKARLIDGDNYGGTIIAETVVSYTQLTHGSVLVCSSNFQVTVPQGYMCQSKPPS